MRHLSICLCLLIMSTVAFAQNNYDASLISKELLPYASAVVRNEQVIIEVKDLDNTTYHVKKAITVLNKNGDDIAHMVIWHNKSNIIRYIKGRYYNEFGKIIGKFSESDFEDVNAANDFSLFEDSRVKHFIPSVTNYPYTIEYEYEIHSKQSLTFNDWEPNPQTGLAVEKSTFTFICKRDFNIRYKEVNIPGNVSISNNSEGFKTYSWQIQGMKAVRYEPYSPYNQTYLSSVKIAPEKFMYEGLSGSFTNWKELGKWVYDKLLINRTEIPTETAEHIKEITANIADPKFKAKKIYEYMQQKTHYISIQIGIGGFQPFLASDVDKLNYGDCKALVNYTRALLKTVNIDSYYCVVESGRQHKVSLLNDFASMDQGDHIILCVPFKNDTTWLECTSQQIPFGFLSDFTDDRTVLACTPDGGKLLRTPKYTTEENTEKRKANFVINETGELKGTMETVFKGVDYDDRQEEINDTPLKRIKDIEKKYDINNLEIQKVEYKQFKSPHPVTTENIQLSARDYGLVSGGKFHFMLNSLKRIPMPLKEVRNRLNPVNINRGYTEEDEISYVLPKGYHVDEELLKLSIDKPFGNFTAVMTLNGDQLLYKRKLQMRDGTYSKDTYQDMVDFFQTVYDADGYNVALVKN
jgi:Domain of Unknown Function with PDB structure (DUF3857)